MKYFEFTFSLTPDTETVRDVLSAVLAEVGFDSFVATEELDRPKLCNTENPAVPVLATPAESGVFKAYIQQALFAASELDQALRCFPLPDVHIDYTYVAAEDKDWNKVWEENYFRPIVIGRRLVISSTFHTDVPQAEYAIKINPQMSFGTGHHATTSQMAERLLETDLSGLEVLDMGCGTSILAILAKMRGARHCVAVDIDEWCVRNSEENIRLNAVSDIDVYEGDASCLSRFGSFDLIIANINLLILTADMPVYAAHLKPGARLFTSGYYVGDIPCLQARAEECGLRFVDSRHQDEWACVCFEKC